MKYKLSIAFVIAALLANVPLNSAGADCQCRPSSHEVSVTAYYVHWKSLHVRALNVKDVIAAGKVNCSVVNFRLSESYDVGLLLKRTIGDSKLVGKNECAEGSIDCRTVYVVRSRKSSDTISFGRSSCMRVNGNQLPIDKRLMRELAVYLPRWQSDFILGDTLNAEK